MVSTGQDYEIKSRKAALKLLCTCSSAKILAVFLTRPLEGPVLFLSLYNIQLPSHCQGMKNTTGFRQRLLTSCEYLYYTLNITISWTDINNCLR